MTLVLLIGGARSGKSRLALDRAEREGAPVWFIATGEALDAEMTDRIERHRAERPAAWSTVEEPVELERALAGVPDGATAVVECLSLWVANVFESTPVEELSAAAARVAAGRPGLTIAVTNEVGLGIVPDNALARAYRDALGRVNAQWAEAADEAQLVVAGRTLALR
jgi:adenosylcobinamide kinase / adenosylcobinamide-phosphate guanylyltransferase